MAVDFGCCNCALLVSGRRERLFGPLLLQPPRQAEHGLEGDEEDDAGEGAADGRGQYEAECEPEEEQQ